MPERRVGGTVEKAAGQQDGGGVGQGEAEGQGAAAPGTALRPQVLGAEAAEAEHAGGEAGDEQHVEQQAGFAQGDKQQQVVAGQPQQQAEVQRQQQAGAVGVLLEGAGVPQPGVEGQVAAGIGAEIQAALFARGQLHGEQRGAMVEAALRRGHAIAAELLLQVAMVDAEQLDAIQRRPAELDAPFAGFGSPRLQVQTQPDHLAGIAEIQVAALAHGDEVRGAGGQLLEAQAARGVA
ncbi:hypothetical protein D3C81_914470 [compost metagenome]